MYHRIEMLQGSESEISDLLKKMAELELEVIQKQSHLEVAQRDKRQAESDLDALRDKLKDTISDKLELEKNLGAIQKHELTRLNDLELKFSEVSEQYIRAKEELQECRVSQFNLQEELEQVKQGRQNFKEQYLEMREVNKDLKIHFEKLNRQIQVLE